MHFIIVGKLTSITIPNSVTSIGNSAFYECSKLTSITLPNNLTSIGRWVFRNSGLITIKLPTSITTIGVEPFTGCKSLTTIEVPTAKVSGWKAGWEANLKIGNSANVVRY